MTSTQIVFAKVLGMSENEYAEYIYQRGVQWLHHFHQDDYLSIELFEASAHFWRDWREMFEERDGELMDLFSAEQIIKLVDRSNHAGTIAEFHALWSGAHSNYAIRECPHRSTLKLMDDEARERAVAEYHNNNRAAQAVQ